METTETRCWSKTIWQINFTGNQTREESAKMYFIIEKAEKTVFDFSKGTVDFIVLISCCYKMTQYNILNVKLSNLQLNKSKLGIKKDTEVTLKL